VNVAVADALVVRKRSGIKEIHHYRACPLAFVCSLPVRVGKSKRNERREKRSYWLRKGWWQAYHGGTVATRSRAQYRTNQVGSEHDLPSIHKKLKRSALPHLDSGIARRTEVLRL